MSKKEKITTGYSELQIIFKEIGINFRDDGPAMDNLGKQVCMTIETEQGGDGVYLMFNIDEEGNETFVCQE